MPKHRNSIPRRTPRAMLAAVALGAAALCLAACGSSGSSPASGGSSTQDGAGNSRTKIVFVLPSLGNQAYVRELNGAKAAAARFKVDLIVDAPGTGVGTANQLIPEIQDAILQNPAALVVNGGAANTSLVSVLKQAVSSRIKLVTFDGAIPGVPAVSFADIDDAYTSALGGEFLKQELPDGGELGLFACYPNEPVTVARVQGFYKGLQGWKGWTGHPVDAVDTKCDSATARTDMEDMLVAHPQLKAVYATTDQDVQGIVAALHAAHKTNLIVIAHDASKQAAQEILQGKYLQADVNNPFEQIGYQSVEAAVKSATGESVPSQILIKGQLITKANAQQFLDSLGSGSINP